jgi:Putative bacterial sensory transduction regulator
MPEIPMIRPWRAPGRSVGESIQERIFGLLTEAGSRPGVDGEGDIAFRIQGQRLFVRTIEEDVTLLCVFGQWSVDELDADRMALLSACNEVCASLSVVKARLTGRVVMVSAEHVVTAHSDLEALVTLSVGLVRLAVQVWNDALGRIPG